MSFLFPSTPSEGVYTPVVHDHFTTTTNWWITPSGPGDVPATSGDTWNAHANSGSVGPYSNTAMSIVKNDGLSRFAWLRGIPQVPPHGGQVWFDHHSNSNPMTVTQGDGYLALCGGAWGPTTDGDVRTFPQYVVMTSKAIHIKGADGIENTITTVPYSHADKRGMRLTSNSLHVCNAAGDLLGTHDLTSPLTVDLYPMIGWTPGITSLSGKMHINTMYAGTWASGYAGWGLPI